MRVRSSRFGKFLKLYFDKSAKIRGASLATYLLEKSRVTHIGQGERAYHVFYNLLRGLPAGELSKLHLASSKTTDYMYLAHGDPNPAKHDVSAWEEVQKGLDAQGISKEERWNWWQMVAAILLLGNVRFDDGKPDNACVTAQSKKSLVDCEAVLGLQAGTFEKALTKRKIKAGAEFVEQDLKLSQANDGRDALSKGIYSRLFDYLILKINEALAAGSTPVPEKEARIIGIVDIFGFEVFKTNSLEQLCINFANEKLQALFTKSVFEETLKAYEQDGISADEITYTDNKELISLFDTPQTGLWSLLSEECMVPKGSDTGFTDKLHEQQTKGSPLTAVKGLSRSAGFQMAHFAGQVTYSTVGWLDKNKDPLSGDLLVLMQFSDNDVLRHLFTEEQAAPGAKQKIKSNKFKGVVDTFRTQLSELYNVLDASHTHFIRCFKPNDAKAADTWSDEVVSRQLHTSGVLDALRVARTGYPDRMPFEEFANTFADVAGYNRGSTVPPKDQCVGVLQKLEIPAGKFQLGKTRVFLSLGVLDELKTKRTARMAKVCLRIQKIARGMSARKRARSMRHAIYDALLAMDAATKGDNIPELKAAIETARAAGAARLPSGSSKVKAAQARLAELEKQAAARKAATEGLTAAMNGFDINLLRTALQAAGQTGVDPELLATAQSRLQGLEEEERRRKEEEKRLAALEAAKKAAAEEAEKTRLEEQARAEERRLAEERKRREEEEAKRRIAEDAQKSADAKAKVALAEQQKARDAAAAQEAELEAAQRAEQQAIWEEEQLRNEVLEEVLRRGIQFRSEPADVLEYAVYLGMDLKEDIELLTIADEALQADDPEGWEQAESPNGDTYYIHAVTQQVLWQHPLDYSYQQKYLNAKDGITDPESSKEREAPAPRPSAPAPPKPAAPPASSSNPSGGNAAPMSLSSDEELRAWLQRLLGTRHTDLRAILAEPATTSVPVQCYVLRHKSRMGATRFDFFMSLSKTKDMYCFTGKKSSGTKVTGGGVQYTISLDQEESSRKSKSGEQVLGRIKSDRKNMDYTLFDGGATPGSKESKDQPLRKELMHVHFINSLRNRNPGVLHVAVPAVDGDGVMTKVQPSKEGVDGLDEKLRVSQDRDPRSLQIEAFKNREPKFNAESQMYQLDFRGRATHASCKNIQLTHRDGAQDSSELLMGKVDDNKFNVDFQYPFSALQAFAFALIIFDNSTSSLAL